MNGLLKAIELHTLTGLARQLGVTKGVVYQWRKRGRVPPQFCPEIEKITQGVVRCEDLDDSVDWAFIRKNRRYRGERRLTGERRAAP